MIWTVLQNAHYNNNNIVNSNNNSLILCRPVGVKESYKQNRVRFYNTHNALWVIFNY